MTTTSSRIDLSSMDLSAAAPAASLQQSASSFHLPSFSAGAKAQNASKDDDEEEDKATTDRPSNWLPYELSFTENSVLFPWIPRRFYQLRWAVMNYSPLVRRFWGGHYTIGEALAFVIIAGQMLWVVLHWAVDVGFRKDVVGTGGAAAFMLMLVYVAAMHNNSILLLALGLPFERALPWHKLLAASAIFNSMVHGAAYYLHDRADSVNEAWKDHHMLGIDNAYGMEISGWMLLACMMTMSALALPFMIRRNFPLFFRTHVIFAAATGVAALLHGFGAAAWRGTVPLSVPGVFFWVLDLVIRFFYMNCLTSTNKAALRLIPGGADNGGDPVVEMTFPNTRKKFSAGQWVFICIPKLGLLHWHPFTISSASGDSTVSVHFVCSGHWTSQVAQLASSDTTVKAYIEGPYGAPMVDLHGKFYKSFLIMSSGLGWTFLRGWKRQLLQDASRGRDITSITCASVMKDRDRHHADEFSGWDYPLGGDLPPRINLREKVFVTGLKEGSELRRSDSPPPPSQQGCKLKLPDDIDEQVQRLQSQQRASAGSSGASDSVSVDLGALFKPHSQDAAGLKRKGKGVGEVEYVPGRPNIKELFDDAAALAAAAGERRVAVMVCVNDRILDACLKEVQQRQSSSVRFDVHHEAFGF